MLVPCSSSKRSEVRVSIASQRYVSTRSRFLYGGYVLHALSHTCYVCVCVSTWWPPAHTHYHFVTGGILSQETNIFGMGGGACCIGGHIVLRGFCDRWLFDWWTYGPVAFLGGVLPGLLT